MKRCLNIVLLLCVFSLVSQGQVTTSGCYLSGALINPTNTAGCGNGTGYCDLASLYVPAYSSTACGTSVTSGGVSHAKATSYVLPAGCTATVRAEYQKRNYMGVGSTSIGCSNSGMDGSGDSFSITASGGAIASQGSTINVNVGTCTAYPTLGTYNTAVASLTTGCANADGLLEMIVTGGTVTIAGNSNRADELITYTLSMSGTCGPSCNAVLPIELISFFAETGNDYVNLYWKVGSEKNVDHYLLEKSYDAVHFLAIGKIMPEGNSHTQKEYFFTDDFPQKGVNYYRISNFDKDGASETFPMLAVHYESEPKSLWVNQDEQNLYVHFNQLMKDEAVELMDLTGKVVFESGLSDHTDGLVIPKHNRKGVYILRSTKGLRPCQVKVLVE
jgi:hypothetical protein